MQFSLYRPFTNLVQLIPKHFLQFDETVNEAVSLQQGVPETCAEGRKLLCHFLHQGLEPPAFGDARGPGLPPWELHEGLSCPTFSHKQVCSRNRRPKTSVFNPKLLFNWQFSKHD